MSSPASSAGPAAKGADAGMIKQLKTQSQRNIKKIADACKDNLELQMILLSDVDKYNKVRETTATGTISQAMQNSGKKKARQDFHEVEDAALERWLWSFKKWGPSLIQHLAMYCDHSVRSLSTCKIWNQKDICQQLLEYAWDIQVSGTEVDFVLQVNKLQCFEELKKAYAAKGHCLQKLSGAIAAGVIEWSALGHYEVKAKGEKYELINKTMSKTVVLPDGLVQGVELADMRLAMNWSLIEATLLLQKDSVKCSSLFPTLKRSLKRAASNEDPGLIGRAKHQRRVQNLAAQEAEEKQNTKRASGKAAPKRTSNAAASSAGGAGGEADGASAIGEMLAEAVDPASLM